MEGSASMVHEDINALLDVCEAYIDLNYEGDMPDDQVYQMIGVFMAGAASFWRLMVSVKESEMPDNEQARLIARMIHTAESLAMGNLIKITVQQFEMPPMNELN